jgi:hypothetical protein
MGKAIKPIMENQEKKGKRPSARKLLLHLNYYTLHFKEVAEAIENNEDPMALGERANVGETYKKSMAKTSKELGELNVSSIKKPDIMSTIGRAFVRTKHLLRFASESKLADSFGDKVEDKAKGAKMILDLRKMPLGGASSAEAFDKWFAEMESLVSKDGNEERTRQWMVNLITILEGSINGQKWRHGINAKDMGQVITISNRIRQAMERNMVSDEEDVSKALAKIESLDKEISKAKRKASGELPKELREHFNKNNWLKRAAGFMGLKSYEGGKAATIGAGKGIGKGVAWVSKKAWGTIKAHPWKTIGVIAGLATGTLVGGAIVYGMYKGYKRFK